MGKEVTSKGKFAVILDDIIANIGERVPPDKLHHIRYFPVYDQIIQRHPVFLTITKFSNLMPFYICCRGLKFLGFKGQRGKLEQLLLQSFQDLMPPENMYIIQRRITHFYNKPDKDFEIAYQVKSAEFGWKWVYGVSRLLANAPDKSTGYIITVARDIEALLDNSMFSGPFSGTGISPKEEARFQSLSAREKQILQMYSLGKKNGEVSKILGISPQTLQTHRKNIYKKLEISNSAGLVRYALLVGNK